MRNNKGFSLVAGLLIVSIMAIVGFAGYYVWNENQDEATFSTDTSKEDIAINESENVNQSDANTVGAVEMETFSIDIPEGWSLDISESAKDACGDGKTREYQKYSKSDGQYVSILVNDCGKSFESDIVTSYNVVDGSIEVIKQDLISCGATEEPGLFCSANDDRLDISIIPNQGEKPKHNFVFMVGNANSEEIDRGMILEKIRIIETLTIK